MSARVRSWRGEKHSTRHSPVAPAMPNSSSAIESTSESARSASGDGASGSNAAKSFTKTKVES